MGHFRKNKKDATREQEEQMTDYIYIYIYISAHPQRNQKEGGKM